MEEEKFIARLRLGVYSRKDYILIKDFLCDLRVYWNGLVYVQFRQPLLRVLIFKAMYWACSRL